MRDPLAYYRNNTMTTRSLLNAAVKCGVSRFIFSSTAAVYGNPDQVPVPETRADAAAVALRLLEADDRNHAARRRLRARHELCRAALLQCRRRRSAGAHRACDRRRDPSAEDRGRGRHRAARQDRRVRHRLSDAGRQLHPRFHPCQRSGAGPSRRAGLSARRRRFDDAELRLWPRLFGARDHRGGAARLRAQFRGSICRRAGPATS